MNDSYFTDCVKVVLTGQYIEIPEHTKTPEHTGIYRNTL